MTRLRDTDRTTRSLTAEQRTKAGDEHFALDNISSAKITLVQIYRLARGTAITSSHAAHFHVSVRNSRCFEKLERVETIHFNRAAESHGKPYSSRVLTATCFINPPRPRTF